MQISGRARVVCALVVLLAIRSVHADDAGGQVKIDSPRDNAVITAASIQVSGTVIARTRDLGVTVNDVAARLDLDHAGTKGDPFRWFAEVEAPAGRVKLKARLRFPERGDGDEGDDNGGGASTLHVQFVPVPRRIRLEASPSSGIAPLDVTFAVRTDPADEIGRFELDYDGNGSWDLTADSIPDDGLVFRYSASGIRLPIARVTMKDGTVATATAVIHAQSFTTTNALLKDVWSGFGQSLAKKDVDAALEWLAGGAARDKYRSRLTLIRASLPQFATGIRTLHSVWIREDVAHYLMTRTEDGRLKGYHVYFTRDANGLWKIVQF